jgi:TonB-dependent SusC/RagA subfamily outer membrane receptor
MVQDFDNVASQLLPIIRGKVCRSTSYNQSRVGVPELLEFVELIYSFRKWTINRCWWSAIGWRKCFWRWRDLWDFFCKKPIELYHQKNIEYILYLKDASSTAIYGSRGANGVIVIQLKKGNLRTTVNVQYFI